MMPKPMKPSLTAMCRSSARVRARHSSARAPIRKWRTGVSASGSPGPHFQSCVYPRLGEDDEEESTPRRRASVPTNSDRDRSRNRPISFGVRHCSCGRGKAVAIRWSSTRKRGAMADENSEGEGSGGKTVFALRGHRRRAGGGEARGALLRADGYAAEAKACRDVHPPSLEGSAQKLFLYLTGWLGGPPLYNRQIRPPDAAGAGISWPRSGRRNATAGWSASIARWTRRSTIRACAR